MGILLSLLGLLLTFYWIAKVCDGYFVESLEIITKRLKISDDVAGATFMAIGSSAPEFFTAVIALSKVGIESVGAGTIVGSAIFNILVIVGATAVVTKTFLRWRPILRDVGFYLLSLTVLLITFWDGVITRDEALMYLVVYALYLWVLSQWKKWFPAPEEGTLPAVEKEAAMQETNRGFSVLGAIDRATEAFFRFTFPDLKKNPHLYGWTFVLSVIYIAVLSYVMVELGVHLAELMNVPKAIIALTILAAGTSVPDLISSVIAAKRGYSDMAVSNAIGSNVFDILIGLGLPWFLFIWWKNNGTSITVGAENLWASMILLVSTVVLLALILIGKHFEISKREGWLLVSLYVLYLGYSIMVVLYPNLALI